MDMVTPTNSRDGAPQVCWAIHGLPVELDRTVGRTQPKSRRFALGRRKPMWENVAS
jgi:hypothetical protein